MPPNRERPRSCRPESSVTARLVASAFRAGPSPQPLAAARVPSALTAAAVACSAHEPCLPGDPQVRLPHGRALTVPPFSRRYAIPPEHGKRLERLAIGRCLRRWGGPGGEARAREAGRLPSSQVRGALGSGFRERRHAARRCRPVSPPPRLLSRDQVRGPSAGGRHCTALHSVLLLSPQARASVS